MEKVIFIVLKEEDYRQQLSLGGGVTPLPWQKPSCPVSYHPLLSVLNLGGYPSNGARVDAKVGVQDEGVSLELRVCQNGCGYQLLLHQPEGLDSRGVLVELRNSFLLFLSGILDEGCRNGGIVVDEPPAVPALP